MSQSSTSKRGLFSWVLPALFAVSAVTLAAVVFETERVETDLTQKVLEAAEVAGAQWVDIALRGRDATINVVSGDAQKADQVIEKVKKVKGLRRLSQFIELAPVMSPYILKGFIQDGQFRFEGGVPSTQVRNMLFGELARDKIIDDTQLRSAHPALEDWIALTTKAIEILNKLPKGRFTLTGLELVIEGEARDETQFFALNALELDGVKIDIKLPLVDPYTWQMSRTTDGVTLSGYLPSQSSRQSLADSLADFGSLTDGTKLARGASLNIDEQLEFARQQLVFLNPAEIAWTPRGLSIQGETTSIDARKKLKAAIETAPPSVKISKVDILDPVIMPYRLSLAKSADGVLRADGFAPDEAAREALTPDHGMTIDIQDVEIARGAPENYTELVDLATKILQQLQTGEVRIVDDAITASGRVATIESLSNMYALGVPESVTLNLDQISPLQIGSYQFEASKSEYNQIQIIGYAPTQAMRAELIGRDNVSGILNLVGGAPDGFESDVDVLFAKLALLKQGRFELEDAGWVLEGIAKNPQDYQKLIEADDALSASGRLRIFIDPARVDMYAFTARKTDSKTVLEGFVPSQSIGEIVAPLGENVDNLTLVALGEPAGFSQTIAVGLKALALLDEGTLMLGENGWSFTGSVSAFSTKQDIITQLSTLPGVPEGWRIEVNSPPPVLKKYTFLIDKKPDQIMVSGFVPNQALADRFNSDDMLNADALELGLGEPENFEAHVELGLQSLAALDTGTFGLHNGRWTLSGQTDRFSKRQALLGTYDTEYNAALVASWQINIDSPMPVDPYIFSIALNRDQVALSGYVPEDELKNTILEQVQDIEQKTIDDQLAVGEGAPADFEQRVLGALKLATNLYDGEVALTPGGWLVRGRVSREAGIERFADLIALEPELFDNFTVDIEPPPPTCDEYTAQFDLGGIMRLSGTSSEIMPGKYVLIDKLLDYALQCADTQIFVESHTHDQGEARDNLVHTARQADAIVNYLVANGVSPARLVSVGYGENVPLVPNSSRAGRAINQRIEIKIVDTNGLNATGDVVSTEETSS